MPRFFFEFAYVFQTTPVEDIGVYYLCNWIKKED